MTREEYEKLLQSDYWKGYSYSLIKERNFTCEDCGRSFPNMRHMLQVHHLVYRDANPWSYNPEELIVLCKECHQKRHGIYPEEEVVPEEETSDEKIDEQPYTNTYTEELSKRYAYDNSPRKKKNWFKYAVLAYVILYLLYLLLKDDSSEQNVKETTTPVETSITNDVEEKQKEIAVPVKTKKKSVTKKQETKKKSSNAEMEKPLVEQKQSIAIESLMQPSLNVSQEEKIVSRTNESQNSAIEISKDNINTIVEKKRTKRTSTKSKENTQPDKRKRIFRDDKRCASL
jgi:hypothetical protein